MGSPRRGPRREIDGSMSELTAKVRQEFPRLVGRPVDSVSGISREGSQGWRLIVEAVELERIPPSTSVLGSYEVEVDSHGRLTGFRRLRRYYRNQAEAQ